MKDRLTAVRDARDELKRLKRDLRALEAIMYVPSTSVLTEAKSGHRGAFSGILEALTKREELEERYDRILGWYVGEVWELEKMFDALLCKSESDVLKEYYIAGRTWREVSESLSVSESWMFKLHKRAIRILKESMAS